MHQLTLVRKTSEQVQRFPPHSFPASHVVPAQFEPPPCKHFCGECTNRLTVIRCGVFGGSGRDPLKRPFSELPDGLTRIRGLGLVMERDKERIVTQRA